MPLGTHQLDHLSGHARIGRLLPASRRSCRLMRSPDAGDARGLAPFRSDSWGTASPGWSMDAPMPQLVSLLAATAWLEDHCRRQAALGREAGRGRLAAALVRAPLVRSSTASLNRQSVAVVGGAGAGKRTLSTSWSAPYADANPQAALRGIPPPMFRQRLPPAGRASGLPGPLRKLDHLYSGPGRLSGPRAIAGRPAW